MFLSIEYQANALSFKDLKGFDENMKLQSQDGYLHPAVAYSFSRLPLLTNIYNYPNAEKDARYNNSNPTWDLVKNSSFDSNLKKAKRT